MRKALLREALAGILVGMAIALLVSPAGAQELEVENLPEPNLWEEPMLLFADAEELFRSANQSESVPMFAQFRDKINELSRAEEPPTNVLDAVAQSHYYEAVVRFNFGEEEAARESLRALLEIDPGFDLNRDLVSRKFIELFSTLRDETIGALQATVNPLDADIALGRFHADASGLLHAPAGSYTAQVTRPGFSHYESEVEIVPGETKTLEATLERLSAVLTLITQPAGVEIAVDEQPKGVTKALAEDPRQGILVVDGLQTGTHEVQADLRGYRNYRARAQVTDLLDYTIGPIELEPTRATVVLRNMPAGTIVRANDEVITPRLQDDGALLILPPDEYQLLFSHPDRGLFESQLTLADQDTVELEVRLRPAIAYLGVVGGDETAASRVKDDLSTALSSLQRWTVLDRTAEGAGLLQQASFGADGLRAARRTGTNLDWDRFQSAAAEATTGSLYVLAVLDDDLLARNVDLWLLPSPPSSAKPDVLTVPLDGSIPEALALLDRSVFRDEVELGASIVDSALADGPVVFAVERDRPAGLAGLGTGDVIRSIAGTAVSSVADVHAALAQTAAAQGANGQTIPVEVSGPRGDRTVDLPLQAGPRVLGTNEEGVLYAAAAQELVLEAASEQSVHPAWLLAVDTAMIHLRHGEAERAIEVLRGIELPPVARHHQGMIDYFLAVALLRAGPSYVEGARSFLDKAADSEAHLYHEDGPPVAPRAKVRLEAIP